MNNKLIQNIQQQTKRYKNFQLRLLDQLEQLETNKEDLTEEQYEEIKESTLADLATFQHYLTNLQKGDQILQSEIEKSKKQIIEACKKSINKETIMNELMNSQAKGIRAAIQQLDKSYHLKKIPQNHYNVRRRQLLVELQELGIALTQNQNEWLQLHHFDESGETSISKKVEEEHMNIASKNIKKID